MEIHKCNRPFNCSICLDDLFQKNYSFLTDYVFDKSLPTDITRLCLEVPPLRDNLLNYYSFKGVEVIFYNLFKTSNRSIIQDLRNGDVLFRISLRVDVFYVLPKLNLEIYFLKKLETESVRFISENIKTLFLVYTFGKGVVEIIPEISVKKVLELFQIDFLIGLDISSLKSHSITSEISWEQFSQLEYFSQVPTKKIHMGSLINNPLLNLFEDEKRLFKWT